MSNFLEWNNNLWSSANHEKNLIVKKVFKRIKHNLYTNYDIFEVAENEYRKWLV